MKSLIRVAVVVGMFAGGLVLGGAARAALEDPHPGQIHRWIDNGAYFDPVQLSDNVGAHQTFSPGQSGACKDQAATDPQPEPRTVFTITGPNGSPAVLATVESHNQAGYALVDYFPPASAAPGTYVVTSAARDSNRDSPTACTLEAAPGHPLGGSSNFILRPWSHRFVDMQGQGVVGIEPADGVAATETYPLACCSGGGYPMTTHSPEFTTGLTFYSATASQCQPGAPGCVPRFVVANSQVSYRTLRGVFDLDTGAFVATTEGGVRLLSFGTAVDGTVLSTLTKLLPADTRIGWVTHEVDYTVSDPTCTHPVPIDAHGYNAATGIGHRVDTLVDLPVLPDVQLPLADPIPGNGDVVHVTSTPGYHYLAGPFPAVSLRSNTLLSVLTDYVSPYPVHDQTMDFLGYARVHGDQSCFRGTRFVRSVLDGIGIARYDVP